MTSFHFLLNATGVTFGLAFCALLLGLFLAILFALGESMRCKPISAFFVLLVTMIRGLPEILVVFSLYFGLSMLYPLLVDGFTLDLTVTTLQIRLPTSDPNSNISPFWCGVIALSLLYAAYASQTLRGAINAIPQGQWEAGQALGLSKLAIYYRIIMPQMWQHALPGLGNQWLVLLKDTALVSLIGVNDLMHQSNSIIAFTKAPFTWYLIAAAIYLFITLISQALLRLISQHATRFNQGNSE